jgi:hypothetical protein
MKRLITVLTVAFGAMAFSAAASSHREAPLISNDPLADNTDVYAFRSPADTNKIVLIANYIPAELAHGGPNWYSFGTGIRYEIHVDNNSATPGDDIVYRFTFQKVNEDTTTFFNIRLGKRNQRNSYTLERSMNGGTTFSTIVSNGVVPPPNIGPRSIEGAAGLNRAYDSLVADAVITASTGEKVFAGPRDDAFFVDLGGAFDLGGFRQPGRDALAKYNVHSLVIEVPIATLQKNGQGVSAATSILDPNYVIGVWASASRQQVRTLSANGDEPTNTGNYVQVSRLGMPLTNEVVVALGAKDRFNASTPANDYNQFRRFLEVPELALYIDSSFYASAVPGLSKLRIQKKSRPDVFAGGFNFGNGGSGLFPLKGSPLLIGTALAPGPTLPGGGYGDILLPNATSPRAVDILPIFLTGVPNLPPYQLATGKTNFNFGFGPALNPLSAGKPFINNFLPTLGDMLRLNMAVPVTSRTDPKFSSLGIIQAAVLGLTDPAYNTSAALQFIPNMDGFPNGRRLEDDVTTIELQAVSGVALAAIGLFYDDYTGAPQSPLTARLDSVLTFNAGVTKNDTTIRNSFPYLQTPWRGFNGSSYSAPAPVAVTSLNLGAPEAVLAAFPNPFVNEVKFRYHLARNAEVMIVIADINGRTVQVLNAGRQSAGDYVLPWTNSNLATGSYFARLAIGGQVMNTVKLIKVQ